MSNNHTSHPKMFLRCLWVLVVNYKKHMIDFDIFVVMFQLPNAKCHAPSPTPPEPRAQRGFTSLGGGVRVPSSIVAITFGLSCA